MISYIALVDASKRFRRCQEKWRGGGKVQNDLLVARIAESDFDKIAKSIDVRIVRLGDLSGVRFADFYAAAVRCRQMQRAYWTSRRDAASRNDMYAAQRTLDGLIETIEKRRPLEEGGGVQADLFAGGGQ